MAEGRNSRGGDNRRGSDSRGAGRPTRSGGRSDRPVRSSRPGERSDRPVRGERPARSDDRRSERSDRPARGERSDRPARGERSDRPARTGGRSDERRSERSDRPARGERSERPARSDDRRSDRPARGERPSRPGSRSDDRRSDRPARGERSDRPARSGERSDRPVRSSRPGERSERPARSGGRSDDRRSERPVRDSFPEVDAPPLPDEVDLKVLPKQVHAELRNLPLGTAAFVSKHLAVAASALDSGDPETAYAHAVAARVKAARLASVRELCGLTAYHCGKWSEALNEFRTYQRLTGDPGFLPLMADCERGLGRPLRAIAISKSEQVRSLDAEGRLELKIVVSGARRDLGQFEAALAVLDGPELKGKAHTPQTARIRYAYAEALLDAGRSTEARDWFVKAALADVEDLTDAADRALEIEI